MNWIRNWSEEIIISIIVATIIEMLLPNSSSKKYIKILIGIFVVYNIISPIIDIVTGEKIEQSLNVNDVLQTSTVLENNYDNISKNAQDSIRSVYAQNLEKKMRKSIESIGYKSGNLKVKVANNDTYEIEKVDIEIIEKENNSPDKKQVYSIVDTVKYVSINISGENKQDNKSINDSDKENIKNHIKEMYDICSDKVYVY